MTSAAIEAMIEMMEALPESIQNQALEQLRTYIAEMQVDKNWDQPSDLDILNRRANYLNQEVNDALVYQSTEQPNSTHTI